MQLMFHVLTFVVKQLDSPAVYLLSLGWPSQHTAVTAAPSARSPMVCTRPHSVKVRQKCLMTEQVGPPTLKSLYWLTLYGLAFLLCFCIFFLTHSVSVMTIRQKTFVRLLTCPKAAPVKCPISGTVNEQRGPAAAL